MGDGRGVFPANTALKAQLQATQPKPCPMTAIHYTVEAADLHAHLFKVTLIVPQPAAQQTVSLPVWIPGSYLVREFSKNLQNLSA